MSVSTVPAKGSEFWLTVTGFTNSTDHGIDPSEYCLSVKAALREAIERVRESYPNLVVVRGSKAAEVSFDAMAHEVCSQLGVPQLVFSVEHWPRDEAPDTSVVIFPDRASFGEAMAEHADLVMAFGGGQLAADIVASALFTHRRKVILLSPYSALQLDNPASRQSIERLIDRIMATPSSQDVTMREEICRIVDEVSAQSVVLSRSKQAHGLKPSVSDNVALPRVDENNPQTGVFTSPHGTVVRWQGKKGSIIPPNSHEVLSDGDRVLYERVFSKAHLVPLEGIGSVAQKLEGLIPLGAIGYSSINGEREPLLGISQSSYEEFVSLVMQVVAPAVEEKLSRFTNTRVGFVFGATDFGVDKGVFKAAQALNRPIVGIVAQRYLHYAVDEHVDIVFTPNSADYPRYFRTLLTGGAVLPLGGAGHSFGQDLFHWLGREEGEVLMIISRLLELYTNQASPAQHQGEVLNAPRLFTSCCHVVRKASFLQLPDALTQKVDEVLWTMAPSVELMKLSAGAGTRRFE